MVHMQMRDPIPHSTTMTPHAASHADLRPFLMTGAVASTIFIACAIFALDHGYRIAPIFLLPLLWGVLVFRRWLDLHPAHFAMYAAALVLHDLGAFRMYQRTVLGISYDIYVHFYFAFAVAFILERAMRNHLTVGRWWIRLATLLFMMGFGALHEIMEYGTYLALGEEKGMLRPSTSYQFDTQRDLLNNLLGTLVALALAALVQRKSDRPAEMPVRIGDPILPSDA